MRLATANTYDNTLATLTTRQAKLADIQEKLTAGKKVLRASDDPTGAAQAERAMTRIDRIAVEQRALNVQRNSMTMAESTLGDATQLLHRARELIISAGNGGYNRSNRGNIAQELVSLRDQLLSYANKVDSNGVPLFGGLASSPKPFTDPATGVEFNGLGGQRASTSASIPGALDGRAVWMNIPSGNGIFETSLGAGNGGTAWVDTGQVISPSDLTGHNYTLTFSVSAGVTTYDVVDTSTTPAPTTVLSGQPYVSGQTVEFDGLALKVSGTPADGDTLSVAPSAGVSLFSVLDQAIAGIRDATSDHLLAQSYTRALAELDSGLSRIQAARGFAGELLNRADTIETNQNTKSDQISADRSRAEDIDMVQGISDFQNQQTGYDAALRTYAQVQRLSLFNYIG